MTLKTAPLPVVAGKDAQLEGYASDAKDGTAAQFEVFKVADGSVITTLDGQVEKGKAKTTWTSVGPDETGKARSHRVNYRVKIDGATSEGMELEVYHDTLEITSQKEDGSSMPDAPFVLTVKGPEGKEIKGNTGSSGTFQVTNLPVGDLELEWVSPLRFLETVEETATKHKAKLKRGVKATLDYPRQGEHKQYVNLPPRSGYEDEGSKLKVRVKAVGGGKKDDELFVKVQWADDVSKRSDPQRDLEGGKLLPWSEPMLGLTGKLKNDGGLLEFELELGKAGGDKVTIHVGGTEACEDEQVEVVNWRRLTYHLYVADTIAQPHPLDDTVANLEKICVELIETKRTVYTREQVQQTRKGKWLAAVQPAKNLGRDDVPPETELYIVGNHNIDQITKDFEEKDQRHLCILFAPHGADGWDDEFGMVLETDVLPVTLDQVKQDVTVDSEGGYRVMVFDLSTGDHPFVSGTWRTVGGKKKSGEMTRDMFVIQPGSSQVTINLENTEPGKLLTGDVKIEVEFRIRVVWGSFVAYAYERVILMRHTKAASVFNQVFTHELGHCMDQTPSEETPPPKGMNRADHEHAYVERGHQGPHCNYGLDDAGATHTYVQDPVTGLWDSVEPLKGKPSEAVNYGWLCGSDGTGWFPGTCLMYGEADPDGDAISATEGICPSCQPWDPLESTCRHASLSIL